MKNKTLKLVLKAAVSAGLVAWLIFEVEWRKVLDHILEIKIWQILAFIAVYLVGILISSIKWQRLAYHKNIKTTVAECFKYYLTGTFINNFFPSFVGGDAYKSYQLGKKKGDRYAEAASTVFVDRITGFVAVMALVLFFSLINYKIVLDNPVLIIVNICIIISFSSDLLLALAGKVVFLKKLFNKLPKIILETWGEIRAYNSNGPALKEAVALGIIFNLTGVAAANYILLVSLGADISPVNYLTVIFVVSIISALPVSINNIGVKEWAYITFFGFFGISSSVVVSAALLSRFLMMLVSFTAIPVYFREKVKCQNP